MVTRGGNGASPPTKMSLPPKSGPEQWPGQINHPACHGPLPQAVADAHRATWKHCGLDGDSDLWPLEPRSSGVVPEWASNPFRLRALVAGRRSIVGFDADKSAIEKQVFFRILSAALPTREPLTSLLPFSRPLVPLALVFVHRVVGLSPGLYALVRDPARSSWLRSTCLQRPFSWTTAAPASVSWTAKRYPALIGPFSKG
eukprot:gnl/TRDRNA2_/TRDRNA2_171415_c2_seq1.p1 gnl/TRDRNA2_/TRDRNA2_171415_c2~~gnl/TRDRNA2_/TRDRNA2_171415_c2_seq1.p1  ORF type:complete len:200 (+),score=10.38 gnl/TRDRNA2_/TRDRNA2_171415_c2_seq1:19-618(+)